jgi:hypothetical protein
MLTDLTIHTAFMPHRIITITELGSVDERYV